jgi:hypothetical protein
MDLLILELLLSLVLFAGSFYSSKNIILLCMYSSSQVPEQDSQNADKGTETAAGRTFYLIKVLLSKFLLFFGLLMVFVMREKIRIPIVLVVYLLLLIVFCIRESRKYLKAK